MEKRHPENLKSVPRNSVLPRASLGAGIWHCNFPQMNTDLKSYATHKWPSERITVRYCQAVPSVPNSAMTLECLKGDICTILYAFPSCIFRTSVSLDCNQQCTLLVEKRKAGGKVSVFYTVENGQNGQVTILPLGSNLPTSIVCACMHFSTESILSKYYSTFTMPQFPYVQTRNDSHFNKTTLVIFVKLWSVL